MIDIDSELDARLRSFYEHIEEQQPSRGFESFEMPRSRPHRRTMNLVPGVAGVAIVAVGVSVFATELASRHGAQPPASASGPATQSGLPSDSQLTLGLPSISQTVIRVTHGHGSASLPTFTAEGIIFVQSACIGLGSFTVETPDLAIDLIADGCYGGSVGGVTVPANSAIDGKRLSLQIVADPSTEWTIVVADSGPVPPLPILGANTIPARAHILFPATDGTGTSGAGYTFSPAGAFFVQYTCTGTGTIDFSSSNDSEHFTAAACANGVIGTQEAPNPNAGPTNITVETQPHTFWDVQVYELPAAKS